VQHSNLVFRVSANKFMHFFSFEKSRPPRLSAFLSLFNTGILYCRWTCCKGRSQWQFSQVSKHRSAETRTTRSQYIATTNGSREEGVQTSHWHTVESVSWALLYIK